jgi:hypothetical protein
MYSRITKYIIATGTSFMRGRYIRAHFAERLQLIPIRACTELLDERLIHLGLGGRGPKIDSTVLDAA